MAYCQNVHRFGEPKEPWAFKADVESSRALELEPDLAEARFARGWAYQALEQMDEAVDWYDRVAEVPEDIAKSRQLKSFALNNAGFICLRYLDDETRAETYLRNALRLYPNKIAHANLGEIHKHRREFEAAEHEFDGAIRLDSEYVNGLNEFGMLYVAWAREAANASQPSHSSDSSGRSLSQETLLKKAVEWHERAISVVLGDHEAKAELHEAFGREYRQWGFDGEAHREFVEAEATRAAGAPSATE
jgi:tetratricopeptide (TPR) repeat protein